MPKRPIVATILLALAATLLIGIVTAQGGSAKPGPLRAWGFGAGNSRGAHPHITRPHSITLRAHDFVATNIDNDPAGTSQGDAIAVEGQLSTRREDSSAGRIDVNEVFTGFPPSGGARLLITITSGLAAGQITAVGVGRVNQSGIITIKIPVVGGTGKYRNARGVLIADPTGNTTRLTYLLIP
jgi:hypothetical protein